MIVTFFTNPGAASKSEQDISLPDLAKRIKTTTRAAKVRLPWLKLARFGNQRTEKNSLRHDANVLAVTGLEGDYDGELIGLVEAVEKARKAGIQTIVYTSPSYTKEKPRWRVLCPFSREYPPDQRNRFMARLNGLFGGVFKSESWALSQSYYYGSVNGNSAHRVVVLKGTPIDLADALDAIAIGKPARATGTGATDDDDDDTVPDEATLNAKLDAAFAHNPNLKARWDGSTEGLNDPTGSGADMSITAFLKRARFTKGETRAALDLFEHGKPREKWDAKYFDRMWQKAPPPDTPEAAALIDEFNEKYFVVNEAGKVLIYIPAHDTRLNRRYFDYMSFADLERLYLNRMVLVGEKDDKPVFANAAQAWLRHPERKQYVDGVVFDPSGRAHPPSVLNLWRGFGVTPRPGSWQLLKDHIRVIICNGNDELYVYVMDWMADAVQNPSKQGEVAIVLRGVEGAGKGILAKALWHLFGQHGFVISNAEHLTGRFNLHLRDCIFLFGDEAFYAGDRKHTGILKSIITEEHLTIEGKFKNVVLAANYLHLMLASNEDWVVPAMPGSRRFCVLDVSKARANDHTYFGAIRHELDHGGHEAMLDELLNRKITSNLRSIPVTEALVDQRKRSLDTTNAWWLDCLHRGYVHASKFGLEDTFAQWIETISIDLLFASYLDYCRTRAHYERHPLSRELLCKWLRAAGCVKVRPRGKIIVGERNTGPGVGATVTSERARCYACGSLDAAREAFTKQTGLTVDWDADEISDLDQSEPAKVVQLKPTTRKKY